MVGWYHMRFETLAYEQRSRVFRCFARLTLRRLDWHVCVSPRLTASMPEFLPRARVISIANGFDPTLAVGKVISQETETVTVLYLSHMGEAKGWRLLLEVAERLCREFDQLRFIFHGEPAYETTLLEIEKAFGRSKGEGLNIHYGGFANESLKSVLFEEADLLCFPSLNEAFPVTIVEAMAAGLPVVASDVGGIGDAIDSGAGGILVPPGDTAALKEALRLVIADAPLRKAFGAHNRSKHAREFSQAAFWNRWSAFLKGLGLE